MSLWTESVLIHTGSMLGFFTRLPLVAPNDIEILLVSLRSVPGELWQQLVCGFETNSKSTNPSEQFRDFDGHRYTCAVFLGTLAKER
jgi:hypothetical protein